MPLLVKNYDRFDLIRFEYSNLPYYKMYFWGFKRNWMILRGRIRGRFFTKKGKTLRYPFSLWGGRSVSNRRPPEPQLKGS